MTTIDLSPQVERSFAKENSWRTAVGRSKPSAPLQWLNRYGMIEGSRVLDYGCGRGFDADYCDFDSYDPHFQPIKPHGKYDHVLCTYVLNTLKLEDRDIVLNEVNDYLKSDGSAYVTVRRNIKTEGLTSIRTYQETVYLNWADVLETNSNFCIYRFYKGFKKKKERY